MTQLPVLPVAIPMLAAAALAALRRWLPRFLIDLVSVAAALLNLFFCLWLLRLAFPQNIVYWFGDWFPRGQMVIGIGFQVDPAAAILGSLAAFLTTLALIYSWGRMESGKNYYQPLMLIFLAAMTGFCFTADLFNLFVFFELMGTAAFALCGLKVEEPAPLQGSLNFAITNSVGAFLTLTGIALLYGATGALNMAQMGLAFGNRHDSLVALGALFVFSGFLIKAAIVPFHFWLPDAHSVSPTPVCVLFSGLMVELGLFAILRVNSVIFGATYAGAPDAIKMIFLFLGALTAVWGGMMCFAEHHLKRVLAFSTISHSGVMLFALALGTREAIAGWLLYLVAHALIKSGLFFTAGILLHRLGTMSEPVLFGRGKKLKFTAALWLLGGGGLAGLPPFALALAEHTISEARTGIFSLASEAVIFISGALTAGAVVRVFLRVFCGWGDCGPSDRSSQIDELPEMNEERRSIPAHLFGPAAVCVLGSIAILFSPSLRSHLELAAGRVLSQTDYIALIYSHSPHPAMLPHVPAIDLASLILHGLAAFAAACLLAVWAVFHLRIPRWARWTSRLEGRMALARQLQSGQPADYVAWITVGIAALGAAIFFIR